MATLFHIDRLMYLLFIVFMFGCSDSMPLPIADGQYVFTHRFAEHPNVNSIKLNATITGTFISLVNNDSDDVFPFGEIESGELFWHKQSGQWIIVTDAEDKRAIEVGGCSDGPNVIDLTLKQYWTC